MGEQALQIVKKGIDIAISAGVFKTSEDVVILHNSLLELQKLVNDNKKQKKVEDIEVSESETISPKTKRKQ